MLIAQITDTHITRGGHQGRYLAEAIAWINGMRPRPDAVVLSGDTANAGTRAEYLILRDILARCDVPVYVVPGNHDRPGVLRDVLPASRFPGLGSERIHLTIGSHPVRLIGLDTTRPGWPGGVLARSDLNWFEQVLNTETERPTLVFMHHPPFRTGVNAADVLGFVGLGAFRTIVGRHPAVRRLVAGHIHCVRRATIAQACATTGVSTAPQRVPEVFERGLFGLRAEQPGFATHAWTGADFVRTTYVNIGGQFAAELAPLPAAASAAGDYGRRAAKRKRM